MKAPTLVPVGYPVEDPPSDPRADRENWPFMIYVDQEVFRQDTATPDQIARAGTYKNLVGYTANENGVLVTDSAFTEALSAWWRKHPDPVKPVEAEPPLYDAIAAMKRIEAKLDKIVKHFGLN